jgi:hypothetical protein
MKNTSARIARVSADVGIEKGTVEESLYRGLLNCACAVESTPQSSAKGSQSNTALQGIPQARWPEVTNEDAFVIYRVTLGE